MSRSRRAGLATAVALAALTVPAVATAAAAGPTTPASAIAPGPGSAGTSAAPGPGSAGTSAAPGPGSAGTSAAPGPGSAGLGDPYFPYAGNGGYDVGHYDLDLAYRPAANRLAGSATMTARATMGLTRFDLDFRADPQRVTVDGRTAHWRRTGQELVVTPARVLRSGAAFTVVVRYDIVPRTVKDPDGSADGWIRTDDGAAVASEPQGSPSWYPCNDNPRDKATFAVRMTVPADRAVVSNGTLTSVQRNGGLATYNWRERQPVATYLTTATVGKFTIDRSTTPSGLPVYSAYDPREAAASRPVVAKLPAMIAFFGSVYGRYPFGNTGVIVDHASQVGYALEVQTRPFFDRAPNAGVLSHELAHQWFGDSVSLTSWQQIWLNEGFAEFSAWLWSEHAGGRTAQQIFAEEYKVPASDTAYWNPPPGRPGSGATIFDGTVYNRGAMTLQALRVKVGDRAFFRTMRDWATAHRHGHGTVGGFVQLAERDSGRQLDGFFHTWLYRPGKPTSW